MTHGRDKGQGTREDRRITRPSIPLSLHHSERGFTILLAALVATLVLALGISVFSIAQKQIILSSLGRGSQYAFYAADTAAECALYWDVRFGYFSSSTPGGTPTCDGAPLSISPTTPPPGQPVYTMTFEYQPNGFCARVAVTKDTINGSTVIEADGFSTECSEIDTSNRSLQRSVELSY